MNPLYPIFLKLHQLQLLIVGAGEVGYEKLFFILKSSPDAQITMIAPDVNPKIEALLVEKSGHRVHIIRKPFEEQDVKGFNLVIAATDNRPLNQQVRQAAKAHNILANVADTPDLCDFYLGSIVTRGDLKVAISTNGKSPTFSKRFRQLLEDILPTDVNDLLQNLHIIRDRLKGDFAFKIKKLNQITESLVKNEN